MQNTTTTQAIKTAKTVPGEASGAPPDAGEGGPEEVLRGAAEASPME